MNTLKTNQVKIPPYTNVLLELESNILNGEIEIHGLFTELIGMLQAQHAHHVKVVDQLKAENDRLTALLLDSPTK